VPVEVIKKMGADLIIAVNVTPDASDRVQKLRKEPSIFHVIMQSIYITTYAMSQHNMEYADIVIEPDLAHIGAGDFQKAKELIKRGEQAALNAIPEIKRRLDNL
jgi:NTE family protein